MTSKLNNKIYDIKNDLSGIMASDLFAFFLHFIIFRPRSHGNAIVPFHLRSTFWNAKIDCSHGNGTIAYRFLFLFTRERNRSVPQFSF